MKKVKIVLYIILIVFIVLVILPLIECKVYNEKLICKDIENNNISYYDNFKYNEWVENCKYGQNACESMYKHMIFYNKKCHDNNQTELKQINRLYNKVYKELFY